MRICTDSLRSTGWNDEYSNLQFELKEFDPGWSGRTFSISNISLVSTFKNFIFFVVNDAPGANVIKLFTAVSYDFL
jgi:hypothetical protein